MTHPGRMGMLCRLHLLASFFSRPSNYILKSFTLPYSSPFPSLVTAENLFSTCIFLCLLLRLNNICCALIIFQDPPAPTPGTGLPASVVFGWPRLCRSCRLFGLFDKCKAALWNIYGCLPLTEVKKEPPL